MSFLIPFRPNFFENSLSKLPWPCPGLRIIHSLSLPQSPLCVPPALSQVLWDPDVRETRALPSRSWREEADKQQSLVFLTYVRSKFHRVSEGRP